MVTCVFAAGHGSLGTLLASQRRQAPTYHAMGSFSPELVGSPTHVGLSRWRNRDGSHLSAPRCSENLSSCGGKGRQEGEALSLNGSAPDLKAALAPLFLPGLPSSSCRAWPCPHRAKTGADSAPRVFDAYPPIPARVVTRYHVHKLEFVWWAPPSLALYAERLCNSL